MEVGEILTLLLGVITIIAVIYGPIAAVKVGKKLQDRQHSLNRRDNVFVSLMSMRRITLHIDHVKALNMIDIEFASNSAEDSAVRDKWKRYLNHLEDRDFQQNDCEGWARQKDIFFFDMLEVMAKALGYEVQRSQIERGCYIPQYYEDLEKENTLFRRSIINACSGISTVKVFPEKIDPTPDFVRQPQAEQTKSEEKPSLPKRTRTISNDSNPNR